MRENFAFMPYVSKRTDDEGLWVSDYDGGDVEEAKRTKTYRTYGCLYTVAIAHELAPPGWRLPTIKECDDLLQYLGNTAQLGQHEGAKLAAGKLIQGQESGFDALLGGFRSYDGRFTGVGYSGAFLTNETRVTKPPFPRVYPEHLDLFKSDGGGYFVQVTVTDVVSACYVRYVRET